MVSKPLFRLRSKLGCYMTAIFVDMLEDGLDVFMDDFSVYEDSFQECLGNLEKFLKRCKETNLVLNWKKMSVHGLVLGHQISRKVIEVNKAKIEIIKNLPNPTNIRGETPLIFHLNCIKAFEVIKKKLISALIIITSNWSKTFIVMCDASDYAVSAILGQKRNNYSGLFIIQAKHSIHHNAITLQPKKNVGGGIFL
ncbi:Retrovirus-related Pol polyprotein from transposon 17.6 [Gossypium australe]|uniref:Retrovirus-related Pol polyprotein from transposon 17.6 n=1 Tax=Gossypium australe TaxID=47621 RepID=A0A5B6VL23_9ROSI|nr:Retrovirus-related Pol polyprotein from transposon 17.6 [Gossypium australe]